MHRLNLCISKSEAEKQLVSQIQKGERVIDTIRNESDIHPKAIRRDYSSYTKTNLTMLVYMFVYPDIFQSFGKFDAVFSKQVKGGAHWEEEALFYLGMATEQVNELKDILDRVKFVPEMSQEAISTSSKAVPRSEPIKPEPIRPHTTQSIQANDFIQSKTLKQKIEDHPISVIVGIAVASASLAVAIMIGIQSTRIDNEKSKYEAIIENQKKEYESQLRELRATCTDNEKSKIETQKNYYQSEIRGIRPKTVDLESKQSERGSKAVPANR